MGEEGQNNFWLGKGNWTYSLASGFSIQLAIILVNKDMWRTGSFGSTIDEFCLIFC